MKNYVIIALSGIVILFSCNNQKKYLIPKDDFVNVLIDINIASSMGNDYIARRELPQMDSAILYQSVLDKYGYSKAQFDSTIAYYTIHPDAFDKIYDKVIANLSKREDELNEELKITKPLNK